MTLVRRLLLLPVLVSLLAFSGCLDGDITILPPAPRDWSASDYTLSVTASETAVQAGARAVVQPGGSNRDALVIEAADRLGIAMVFTGVRHFRH